MPRVRGVIARRIASARIAKPSSGRRFDGHRRRVGELDLLDDGRPVRLVRDDLVAGPEQRERRVVQRLLAARGEDDLRLGVLDAVVGLVAIADRAPQFGDAGDRRVLRELGVEGIVRRPLDGAGRAEVGLARAEIDHFHAGSAQPVHRCRHSHRRRACNPRSSIRQPSHWSPLRPAEAGRYLMPSRTLLKRAPPASRAGGPPPCPAPAHAPCRRARTLP